MTTPASDQTNTTYPFFVLRMEDSPRWQKVYDEIYQGLISGKNAVSPALAAHIIEEAWPDIILAVGDGSQLQ